MTAHPFPAMGHGDACSTHTMIAALQRAPNHQDEIDRVWREYQAEKAAKIQKESPAMPDLPGTIQTPNLYDVEDHADCADSPVVYDACGRRPSGDDGRPWPLRLFVVGLVIAALVWWLA